MKSNPLFQYLASLKLAVLTILSLAGVLALATVYESMYGMRAAHLLVYGTWWFYFILAMLVINVLCAALSRLPWKKRHIGFVVTHAGIILLIFGSWVTMQFGVDGSLPVVEGSQDAEVIMPEVGLTIQDDDAGLNQKFPIPEAARLAEGRLMEIGLPNDERLVVDRFLPRVVVDRQLVESEIPGLGKPAIYVEVFNDRFRVDQRLLVSHPQRAAEVNLGPALITFRKLWTAEEEKAFRAGVAEKKAKAGKLGYLVVKSEGKEFRVDIEQTLKTRQQVGALSIFIDRYLPYAVVEKNELVSKSNEPRNPAVQLSLTNAAGEVEKHSIFAHFPEFSTRHRRKDRPEAPAFGAEVRMVSAAMVEGEKAQVRGRLNFAQTRDDKSLLYQVVDSTGKVNKSGTISPGTELTTGWMDLKFNVLDWKPSALEKEVPRYVDRLEGGDSNFLSAIRLRRESPRQTATSETIDLVEGASKTVTVGAKKLVVTYGKTSLGLPFKIFLEKFSIGNDPGTTKAASYESVVRVRDEANGAAGNESHLISMNEPLKYGGYTFYQASYQLRDGQAPISVFSVNRDPGRMIKYAGSLVMVLGILLMFYFNPHYWDKLLSRKGE